MTRVKGRALVLSWPAGALAWRSWSPGVRPVCEAEGHSHSLYGAGHLRGANPKADSPWSVRLDGNAGNLLGSEASAVLATAVE